MDTPTIAIDLESFRVAAGMTEQQLSDETGIPRTTLRRKLRRPDTFTIAEFRAIAVVLNVPSDALKVAS